MQADQIAAASSERDEQAGLIVDGRYHIVCSAAFAPTDAGVDQLLSEAVIAEWDALALQLGSVPFVRPHYVAAWWRAFSTPDSTLMLWQARRNGRLAAMLPMMRQGKTLRTATNYHTPQSGIVADNTDAATALLRALLQNSDTSQLIFAGFDTQSPDPACCRQAAKETHHLVVAVTHERATYVTTAQGWEAYGKQLGKPFRGDIRRLRNRLQDQGALTVDIATAQSHANPTTLNQQVDEALAIEAAGWKQRNGTSILSSPREEHFYRELAQWAANNNMLRLCFLRLDGKPLAMMYAFENRQKWHLLKTGYDEEYARFSAGKLLLHDCLHHCFDSGMDRIEIHGDAAPHKLRWRPQSRVLERLHVFPATVAGRIGWLRLVLQVNIRSSIKALLIRCRLLRAPAPIPDA